MKTAVVVLSLFLFTLSGCTNRPKAIAYGSDGCHFCSMAVVDKQHAAQFMTKKGRSYTFDATECMLNHLKEIEPTEVELYLVNDYDAPGETIDATEATYLISENIPSPMGEYLSAFATLKGAQIAQAENKGTLYTWSELLERFKI